MNLTLLLFSLLLQAPAPPKPASESGPLALLRVYNQAIQNFQPDVLQTVFAPDYTEVSPAGEVDSRERVLSFYAADKKTAITPTIRLEEPLVRFYGAIAVVVAKEAFARDGGGTFAMRATFVCRKEKGRWRLISSQFTGIRPTAPPR